VIRGPWGQPYAFQRFGSGSVTPGSYNLVFGTPSGTLDQCFMNKNNVKTFQFYSQEEGEEVIPRIIDGQTSQEVYALDLFEINLG